MYHGDFFAGPGTSITVGEYPAIIRDTITITQPTEFQGDVHMIQSELSKLSSIGIVTVTSENDVPDSSNQCKWSITFETNAGDLASLQVARSGSDDFSVSATLESGDLVTVTDDVPRGTSSPITGDFTLEYNGQRTGYIPYNVSASEMEYALSSLSTVGEIFVTRFGPDVNSCYKWHITFQSNLGFLPLIIADGLDLKGTVAMVSTSKIVDGVPPSFDGPDYGLWIQKGFNNSRYTPSGLKQGIPYYFRVTAENEMGPGALVFTVPQFAIPFPNVPAEPSFLSARSTDSSSIALEIGSPEQDGGGVLESYRVDYSKKAFAHETQRISLECFPSPEIQTITTSAVDINEIQHIIIDSSYQGHGIVREIQLVQCDATGGIFGLSFEGDIAYISHDSNEEDIKSSLESLNKIYSVTVSFNQGINPLALIKAETLLLHLIH